MGIQWHPTAAEIVFAVLLMVLPWAFSDMPIAYKCLLWLVAWLLGLHMVFTLWPFFIRLPLVVKMCVAIGLTSFLVALTYMPVIETWMQEGAAKLTGKLVARTSLLAIPKENYAIQIGSVGATFTFFITNHEPWQISGDSLRFDTTATGEMLFSTVMRDRAGDIIVEITNNRWRVSNQQNVSWDKNYRDDCLEVLDGRKRVILQLKLFTNGVQLQGEWHSDDGELALVMAQRGRHGPESEIVPHPLKGQRVFSIAPIFKYPSSEHWRQLEED
jgi:hypothetical protein